MAGFHIKSQAEEFYGDGNDSKLPIYKIILVGKLNAGKTTFFERFRQGKYYDYNPKQVRCQEETSECSRRFSFAGLTGKFQLWDTVDLEVTNSLGNQYFNSSRGVLFVYDVTDETAADELKSKWYKFVEEKKPRSQENKKSLYFVIGTKNDKVKDKAVSIEYMKNLFKDAPIKEFFEVSSTDIDDESFDRCIENIMQTILLRMDGVQPRQNQFYDPPKSSCCK